MIPTFQAVYASLEIATPVPERIFSAAILVGGYALPVITIAVVVQGWRWHTKLGMPLWVAFAAFFSASRPFWHDTEARQLLKH